MIKKQGISLIVLIVTIIVIIILAAVVILTLTKNNPIESAKEARFKEDIRTFQDELAMTVSKQYANAGGKRDTKINADKYTKDGAEDSVYTYISSFKEKYNDKFVIQDDELRYTKKITDKEKEYAKNLNIKKYAILPNEFQQVEYIESTGTQYIDPNCTFSDKMRYVFKINWIKLDTFGANSSNKEVLLIYDGLDSNYLGGRFNYQWQAEVDYEIDLDLKNTSDNLKLVVNNEEVRNVSGSVNGKKCYLFGNNKNNNNSANSITNYTKNKIYYFKVYNEDQLIHDFIPCYCTNEVTNVNGNTCEIGTAGLYDLVEEKFYTNQGTGDFVTGPDV